MRKWSLALAVLVATVAPPRLLPATSYVVTTDFPYVSKYVFRGLPQAGASFQPSLRLTAGGAYAGVWLNQPLRRHPDLEADFSGGWNMPLNGGWSLDAGATLYYYPQADRQTGALGHTFESYLGLNGSFHGTNLGAYLFRDFDLKTTTIQGTAGYSVPLNATATLTLLAALGGLVPDRGTGYEYVSLGVAVPCKLSDTATFTVGVNWATHSADGPGRNSLWATAGLTVSF